MLVEAKRVVELRRDPPGALPVRIGEAGQLLEDRPPVRGQRIGELAGALQALAHRHVAGRDFGRGQGRHERVVFRAVE